MCTGSEFLYQWYVAGGLPGSDKEQVRVVGLPLQRELGLGLGLVMATPSGGSGNREGDHISMVELHENWTGSGARF